MTLLSSLSSRLGALGQHEKALATIIEATETYRQMAEIHSVVHQRQLKQSLEVLARLRNTTSNGPVLPKLPRSDMWR